MLIVALLDKDLKPSVVVIYSVELSILVLVYKIMMLFTIVVQNKVVPLT